eukprot:CAMPEP_0116878534 /NCGR_PEP_ID=MMETSP0463-20121206/10286_1 /TAXON_ID=181622 /ORGANISM="Strombidinopsis sp, Strain SopsisLIS2011" /LENGTH=66 /DNA_ID=CAMNT_0004526855 /DNA_START=287 /DNA_END=487 /DNA_ORIENTATION=+
MGSKRVKFNNIVQKAEYEKLTSEESMDYDDIGVDSLSDDEDQDDEHDFDRPHKDNQDDDDSINSFS